LKGLVVVLQFEDSWEDIGKIIRRNAEKIPVIFENWDYLVSKAEIKLHEVLKLAVNDPTVNFYLRPESADEAIANLITRAVIFSGMNLIFNWSPDSIETLYFCGFDADSVKWIQAIKENKKLNARLHSELEKLSKKFESVPGEISRLKEFVESDFSNQNKIDPLKQLVDFCGSFKH
jgi:hypothetical protein